jgi:hypothetical protein
MEPALWRKRFATFYGDRKKRNQQAYKLSRIHKKLVDQAKSHQLPTFSLTPGTINQRKAFFRTWIQTLRQIFMFHPRFANILQHYPLINPRNMSKTSCMGLAQFLFNYIDKNSREQIKGCIDSEHDGVEL